MAGDFNLCLDPGMDNTSHVQKMHQHQLLDVWRIRHNKQWDFTFHTPVHGTYSRFDFF